jgi:hypothetical protein
MTGYVEWRTFSVHDRVRIRISPECRYPHEEGGDGLTGIVCSVALGSHPRFPEHHYGVCFDHPINRYTGGTFCANELEPA